MREVAFRDVVLRRDQGGVDFALGYDEAQRHGFLGDIGAAPQIGRSELLEHDQIGNVLAVLLQEDMLDDGAAVGRAARGS